MSQSLEGKLHEALEELRLAMGAMQRALPRVLTLSRAAAELSISKRKLQDLLAKGFIQSVVIDGRRMVPSSEIDRLATPVKKRVARRQEPQRTGRPADEAAAVRAAMKRR